MRQGNIIKLITLVLLMAVVAVLSIKPIADPLQGIPLGLDLRGGVHLVLQAEPNKNGAPITNDDLEKAKAIIDKRVNDMGVSEPIVQTDYAKKRMVIDLPGVSDPDKAIDVLKTTAKLTFRDSQGNVLLQGDELKDAKAGQDQKGGYVVNLSFSPAGAKKFGDLTTKNIGQIISVYLDDKLLRNAKVETPILNGQAEIDHYASLEAAAHDAVLMRSGSLPVSMSIAEKRQVGASLGIDSLHKSIIAGIYGLSFIFLFMLAFYRLPGLVADLSLIIYSLIVLWIFWAFGVVLTLPGIAGFILSIGMAVDFNIIIYERIKEEIRAGKSLRAGVESGFSRAFVTVIDAHVTTFIAAMTLYYFGTGSIRGFALTLGIGIIASLFTAITFTKIVLRLIVGTSSKMKTIWFGVGRNA